MAFYKRPDGYMKKKYAEIINSMDNLALVSFCDDISNNTPNSKEKILDLVRKQYVKNTNFTPKDYKIIIKPIGYYFENVKGKLLSEDELNKLESDSKSPIAILFKNKFITDKTNGNKVTLVETKEFINFLAKIKGFEIIFNGIESGIIPDELFQ